MRTGKKAKIDAPVFNFTSGSRGIFVSRLISRGVTITSTTRRHKRIPIKLTSAKRIFRRLGIEVIQLVYHIWTISHALIFRYEMQAGISRFGTEGKISSLKSLIFCGIQGSCPLGQDKYCRIDPKIIIRTFRGDWLSMPFARRMAINKLYWQWITRILISIDRELWTLTDRGGSWNVQ